MQKSLSKKQIKKMQKNSHKLSMRIVESIEGENSVEIMFACMRIITLLMCRDLEKKETAYHMMAELFEIGDSLLKDFEEIGAANWSKK